jgi:hypothetical protein
MLKVERIPKKWQDPDKPGKIHDLTKKDLPVAAVFTSHPSVGRVIMLIKQEERQRGDQFERVEGTGCKLIFRGYKLAVQNEKLLELVMASDYYQRGVIRPDPEDPTGFWRQLGMVQVQTIQVAQFESGSHPKFDDLKLKELKHEEKVEPLRVL